MNTNQICQKYNSFNSALVPTSSPSEVSATGKIASLPDGTLFHLCKTYGERARFWRQKFIGLLPEVNKRKLYEKKGFESIHVFAYKLAGLSKDQVNLALNLEIKFEKTPALQKLLVSGEVSINKLARVASIANSENQDFLAENVKNLSKSAVETLVRDEKFTRTNESTNQEQDGLQEPLFGQKGLPGQSQGGVPRWVRGQEAPLGKNQLNLSPEVHQKLLELQQKGLDINQLLLELLAEREKKIADKKIQVRQQILEKEASEKAQDKEPSRNIPKAAEKILHEEFGTKCAVKGCNKPAEHIHHGLPFSVGKTHDPYLLIPLCKEHHELAHAVNRKYTEIRKLTPLKHATPKPLV